MTERVAEVMEAGEFCSEEETEESGDAIAYLEGIAKLIEIFVSDKKRKETPSLLTTMQLLHGLRSSSAPTARARSLTPLLLFFAGMILMLQSEEGLG